jgi:hypothetical protein
MLHASLNFRSQISDCRLRALRAATAECGMRIGKFQPPSPRRCALPLSPPAEGAARGMRNWGRAWVKTLFLANQGVIGHGWNTDGTRTGEEANVRAWNSGPADGHRENAFFAVSSVLASHAFLSCGADPPH